MMTRINTSQALYCAEIDNIVDGMIYLDGETTVFEDLVLMSVSRDWDFDRFWEDALSIFAEQFSKDEH